MKHELTKTQAGLNDDTSMSEPGPVALALFAVAFFGSVVFAGGVIIASIPAILCGALLLAASLACFILRSS